MVELLALTHLTRDTQLLFATRFIRLFAYGSVSVVLVLYLVGVGLNEQQAGLLLTATLVGDAVISLAITTRADRVERRRMLILGAILMTGAGLVFASRQSYVMAVVTAVRSVRERFTRRIEDAREANFRLGNRRIRRRHG